MADLAMAQRFLDLLGPEEDFTFQTFAESKDVAERAAKEGRVPSGLVHILHGSLASNAKELTRLNDLGAGIFVMVNAGNLRGRSARHVVRVRALFIDLDGAPLEPVEQHTPSPHIIVESSPGKWHAYWRVAGCELNQFKEAQQRLSDQFEGDRVVSDLPRVLRLPGFYHRKGESFMSKLIKPAE